MGFLSFFGGLFWLVRRVFSGFWGFLCFSLFCSCLLGWVAGCGGFRGSGSARPGVLLPSCWGAGLGCACARLSVLLPCLLGGGRGVRVLPGSRGGGRVVPGFFCCLLWWGFSGVVFSVRCFSCLLVLRCLVLCWVVVSAGSGGCGGCRVGFGVVFSPASVVLARACFRFPSWGLVWVWVGFCLESLILAQDERWRRA